MADSETSRRAAEVVRQVTERVLSPEFQTRLKQATERAFERANSIDFEAHRRTIMERLGRIDFDAAIQRAAEAARRIREAYARPRHEG
jgi:hypothetical protein